jgi:uncharacterized protein with PIN domain
MASRNSCLVVPPGRDRAARSLRGRDPKRASELARRSAGLAKATGEPLLFKGDAFEQTDIKACCPAVSGP